MKIAKYFLILWVLILALPSCSTAEKAANERKHLMMPHKSEMKRNSKYKPNKKAYKPVKQKKRK